MRAVQLGKAKLIHADCLVWLAVQEPNSYHAIVTDPPYGLHEFSEAQKQKLRDGKGGVWRIPPVLGGYKRSPVPRFTVLTPPQRVELQEFYVLWGREAIRVMRPGAHLFIATNPLLSHHVYTALIESGFEKRGEVVRLVQTLRGGDRPKNAHRTYPDVTVMPRSAWEPWGLFRKPLSEKTVEANLKRWGTGGLRRCSRARPFTDVIESHPTNPVERRIAPHPALKPQSFMKEIVRAALPLREGVVLDTFMGAGSTLAAAEALGYPSVGIEYDAEFFGMALEAVPKLTARSAALD